MNGKSNIVADNIQNKKQNFLEESLNYLPFPFYIKDSSKNYIYCNQLFSDSIWGISPSELIGKNNALINSPVTETYREKSDKIESYLLKNEKYTFLISDIFCSDGTLHIFYESKFIVEQNGAKFIYGIMIDKSHFEDESNLHERDIQLLKIFMDFVPEEIFFKDTSGKYLKINSSAAINLGLSNELDVIGKTDEDFYDIESYEKIKQNELKVLKSGEILVLDHEKTLPIGIKRWTNTMKIPYPDKNGNIIGLIGIERDISNFKEAEQKNVFYINYEKMISKINTNFIKIGYSKFREGINFSVETLYSFFEASSVSFYLIREKDEDKNIYKRLSSVGDDHNLPLLDKRRFPFWNNKLLNNENLCFSDIEEIEYSGKVQLEKNSVIFNFPFLLIPVVKDSELIGFFSVQGVEKYFDYIDENKDQLKIFSDSILNAYKSYKIEQKRVEMQLQMSKLQSAVEQSGSSVVIINKDGRIEYVNSKYSEITGYSQTEAIGKNSNIKNPKNFTKEEYVNLWKTLSEGEQFDGKLKNRRKNGEIFWEHAIISPIKNSNDEIISYIAIAEDITEKIKREGINALSRKLESIGQLAAGIAHEINSPLQFVGDNTIFIKDAYKDINQFIMGIKDLVEEIGDQSIKEKINKLYDENDIDYLMEEIPTALEQSVNGINRVSKIVKAMKDFAHPSESKMAYNDINKNLADTIFIAKNEWKYAANVETDFDENLPMVLCKIDALNQVFLNIIVNAAHAIQSKFGKSPEQKGEIKVTTQKDNDSILIMIEDNGCGIKQEHLEKIFDPFFTTKEVGKGTGQGLAIAHDLIVNKHNGTISVDSNLGIGTMFLITLPIIEESENQNET